MAAHAEAFRDGWKAAEVNITLAEHEKRLNAINGSISRHADEAGALRESIENLGDRMDEMIIQERQRQAIAEALAEQVERRTRHKWTLWQKLGGGLVSLAVIGGAIAPWVPH